MKSGSGYEISAVDENRYITLGNTVVGTRGTTLKLHSVQGDSRSVKITIDDTYVKYRWVNGGYELHTLPYFPYYEWVYVEGHYETEQTSYYKKALG